jgi:hypothetical protein
MWIGTINGLVKWVNNTWTVYTESNSGLPANHISDIELGVAGTIWVSAHQLQTWPYYGGISKYDGATWTTYTPGNSPLSHIQVEKLKFDPTGMLWISTYSMGMMKFTIPVGGPLPLTLLSFTARKNENKVLLEWKTTLEENTDRFVIERTFDQFAFQPIGTVNAVGFSQNQTSYSFIDEHPGAGNNYYRLKMIDRDGKFTYSQIVRINFGSVDAGFVINTNPVRSELILSYSGANQSVSINMYDAAGRIVIKTNAANEPVIRIGVANLKAGVYIIELIDSEKVYRKKFLKVD